MRQGNLDKIGKNKEQFSQRAFSQNFQNSPIHTELMMSIQTSLERVLLFFS